MRSPLSDARDAGAVTAELAVALTGVVVVLAALLATVSLALAQVRALDAAGAGARAAARGEAEAHVLGLTRRLAGPAARTGVARTASQVTVTVRVPVALPLPGGPAVDVHASATTPFEPQAGGQ